MVGYIEIYAKYEVALPVGVRFGEREKVLAFFLLVNFLKRRNLIGQKTLVMLSNSSSFDFGAGVSTHRTLPPLRCLQNLLSQSKAMNNHEASGCSACAFRSCFCRRLFMYVERAATTVISSRTSFLVVCLCWVFFIRPQFFVAPCEAKLRSNRYFLFFSCPDDYEHEYFSSVRNRR